MAEYKYDNPQLYFGKMERKQLLSVRKMKNLMNIMLSPLHLQSNYLVLTAM